MLSPPRRVSASRRLRILARCCESAAHFALGAVLVGAPLLLPAIFAPLGAWRFALVGWGVLMLGTAAFRFCPAYSLFGIRTCPVSEA